jgi:hypothetical protein
MPKCSAANELNSGINAIPWANVRIVPKSRASDATEGTTPLVVQLPEGEYTLELRNELFQALRQSPDTMVRLLLLDPTQAAKYGLQAAHPDNVRETAREVVRLRFRALHPCFRFVPRGGA